MINKIIAKIVYGKKCKIDQNFIYVNYLKEIFWIESFIKFYFPQYSSDICILSVNGKRKYTNFKCKKIFATAENLEPIKMHSGCLPLKDNLYKLFENRVETYSDYLLNEVDIAIGFKNSDNNKYMRLPYWIMKLFPYNSRYDDIKSIIKNINAKKCMGKNGAVCINSHDTFGTRAKICNDLQDVFSISYAGKWRNNTQDLWEKYNNNKEEYMNLFKFNICPENMDAEDYCTEKIFDAMAAGCIPIYAGALNKPEEGLINYDRVIFWDLDGDNKKNIELIKRLIENKKFYEEYTNQLKLHPMTVDYVAERFELLHKKLREILS